MQEVLEILLCSALLILVGYNLLPIRKRYSLGACLSGILIVIVVIDLLLGFYRLIMLPAIIVSIFTIIFTLTRTSALTFSVHKVLIILGGLLWFAGAVAASVVPLMFPVFSTPAITGDYQVGVTRFQLTDDSRPEPATEITSDARNIVVTVWYPAIHSPQQKPQPLYPDVEQMQHMLADASGLPIELFDYVDQIKGYAIKNAEIAGNGTFPVIVFNHGFGLIAEQNAILMEQLASDGFVVFAIDHPFQADWIRLDDGQIQTFSTKGFEHSNITPSEYDALVQRLTNTLTAKNDADYMRSMEQFFATPIQHDLDVGIDEWVKDTAFLLDVLENPQGRLPNQLVHHLDTQRIGLMGMSFGGATAGQFCAEDSRCQALLNMDGAQFSPDRSQIKLRQPYMMMYSDYRYFLPDANMSATLPYELNDFMLSRTSAPTYSLTIAQSRHLNYTDLGLFLSPTSAEMFGDINVSRMNELVNQYTRAFFLQYLQARPQATLRAKPLNTSEIIHFRTNVNTPKSSQH